METVETPDRPTEGRSTLGIVGVSLAVLTLGLSALIAGCSIGDLVQSKVPVEAQKTEGLPSSLSHNDSLRAYEMWVNKQRSVDVEWRERLDSSSYLVGFLSSIGTDLLMQGEGVVVNSGIPMAGTIAALLAGVGGLFLPKPGTQKEKDSLWDEAYRLGKVSNG